MYLQLTQVNERLSEYSRLQAGGASATVSHTLQRHWDILQDYLHEFRKIRTNVCAVREREELMEVVHRDRFVNCTVSVFSLHVLSETVKTKL